jgi:hypothetical protein
MTWKEVGLMALVVVAVLIVVRKVPAIGNVVNSV